MLWIAQVWDASIFMCQSKTFWSQVEVNGIPFSSISLIGKKNMDLKKYFKKKNPKDNSIFFI